MELLAETVQKNRTSDPELRLDSIFALDFSYFRLSAKSFGNNLMKLSTFADFAENRRKSWCFRKFVPPARSGRQDSQTRHDKVLEQNKNAVRSATTPLAELWRLDFRKVGVFRKVPRTPSICGKSPTLRKLSKIVVFPHSRTASAFRVAGQPDAPRQSPRAK